MNPSPTYSATDISDHSTEATLVAMVAIAPELWSEVGYLHPGAFQLVRAANAWLKLGETLRAGKVPDPREYGEFIGFDPPAIVAEFARDYAGRIARDAYCRSMVDHAGQIAKAAFARDTETVSALASRPPQINTGAGTLETMKTIGSRVWESVADPEAYRLKTKLTGLRGFDAATGEGVETGTLSILMARPGMGKTAALAQIADASTESGLTAVVFSKEMTAEQIYRRMACRRARVNWFRFKRGDLSETSLKLIQEWTLALMNRDNLQIDDSTPQTTQQVEIECRRFTEKTGRLDFVLADHLRLFSDKADNENHRLGKISWAFKMLAKNLDTRIICAAQLNRALEGRDSKIPDLADLRDSGEIEENADNVIALYRGQYYNASENNTAEFHARKVRDGERGKFGAMEFEAEYMNFKELDRSEGKERFK